MDGLIRFFEENTNGRFQAEVRALGRVPYAQTLAFMQSYTASRLSTPAQNLILVCEHDPVFTLGKFGQREHILNPGNIPIVQTDRGGQVTYHGPGQWVLYFLLDLKSAGIGPKKLVCLLEQSLIDWLGSLGIFAERVPGKPGVFVGESKVAALGLKIKRGLTYHGVAINIDMDLSPFTRINPCGYASQPVENVTALASKERAAQLREITQHVPENMLNLQRKMD